MRISRLETIPADRLIARLKQTRLEGHGQALVYEQATLEIVHGVSTAQLRPAQRYVLTRNIERIFALRKALLERDVDLFALDGGCLVWAEGLTDDGQPMPVLPPVVEESIEADGTYRLINDGMHRVWAARQVVHPISIVLARNVPPRWPYYAYPVAGGWQDVAVMEQAPATSEKKAHRNPTDHRALFRRFNDIFPGVQKKRAKGDTN